MNKQNKKDNLVVYKGKDIQNKEEIKHSKIYLNFLNHLLKKDLDKKEKILNLYKKTNNNLKEELKKSKIKRLNDVKIENKSIERNDNFIAKHFNYAIILSDTGQFLKMRRIGFNKSFEIDKSRYLYLEDKYLYQEVNRARWLFWIKKKLRYYVYTLNNPLPLKFSELENVMPSKLLEDYTQNNYMEKLYALSKTPFKFGVKEIIIIGIIIIAIVYFASGGKIV